MAKITRKELKRDEFAAEVSKTYEFVQQQRERILRVGIAVTAVVVLVLGVYFFIQHRKGRAAEELAHAIRVYSVAPGQDPATVEPGLVFADDKAKYTQAEKELAAVAEKYSWLQQGQIARYLLGITKRELGKTDEAIRDLRAVADKGDAQLAGLAKFALAETYARSGKLSESEKLYRELADKPGDAVSKDIALLALANQLEGPKPAEAVKIYNELKKQGTNSAAAETAERRLAEMNKK